MCRYLHRGSCLPSTFYFNVYLVYVYDGYIKRYVVLNKFHDKRCGLINFRYNCVDIVMKIVSDNG